MVRAVPPGTLADRELVLDHPVEVTRLDALRPLALGRHVNSSSLTQISPPTTMAARACALTSWARTMSTPRAIAQVAVANDASRRSSVGVGRDASEPATPARASLRAFSSPIVDLRLVPSTTGH